MADALPDMIVSDLGFVIHRETDAAWTRNLANPTHFLLICAVKGRACYTVGNREFMVEQGDILFFNKGVHHSGYSAPDQPWTYYTVAFDAIAPNGQPYAALPFPMLTHSAKPEVCQRLCETLYYEWTARDEGYRLRGLGIVSELLCRLLRENQVTHKQSAAMEQIKRHMIAHFTEPCSIAELAAMANVSPSHFHRLFKENTGVSAKQYLNSIRMNRAQALLQSGEHNISEVASMVGYKDIYYFSRLFKKITGVPPSAFVPK